MYLRSLLFIPGNQPNMLAKAPSVNPDAFIPDMEDSVAIENKSDARRIITEHLNMLSDTGKIIIPRINSLETGLLEKDLEAMVSEQIYGIAVGKIHNIDEVNIISSTISAIEKDKGLQEGKIKLLLWMETARAIINAYSILTCNERIVGAGFGAEDFTNDMGIERSQSEYEVSFARNQLTIAARAAGILALDTPFFAFKDDAALRDNCKSAKAIGFKGKFAIHPAQIDIINSSFSPSDLEVAHAKKIIETFNKAVKLGRGSTSLDGIVIDIPVVKRAESLLRIACDLNKM
jgi:citrate lyase subunit beta/citryl-CoA lyase